MSGKTQEPGFKLDLDGNEEIRGQLEALCGDPADKDFFAIYEVIIHCIRESFEKERAIPCAVLTYSTVQ